MVRVVKHKSRLYLDAPLSLRGEIKACLEDRRWDKEKRMWHCRDSARNRYVLNHVWKNSPEFNRYYEPVVTQTIVKRWREVLWPHQLEASHHLIQRKRMVYAADMGLGKTLTAFAAIDSLLLFKQLGRVWWVADKSALRAYQAEYDKWDPVFKPEIVINYESLHKAIAATPNPPQLVVFDESTAIKNIKAMRTQQALGLVELMEECWGDNCYVWLFTGTPSPLNPLDWYSQVEVARPGFLKEGDWYRFRERLAVLKKQDFNGNVIRQIVSWKQDQVDYLPKRLAPIVLRHEKGKDDIVELPDKIYRTINLEPSVSTKLVARTIANAAESAATALIKLRQLSDGFQYREDKPPAMVNTPKDDALLDLLEKNNSGRIICYAAFRASIDKIVGICRAHGWSVIRADGRGWQAYGDCEAVPEDFQKQDDRHIAFVGNPGSSGKGITLTASDTIIFYSNSFSAEDRWQAEDRIHRAGSTGANIIDLIHLPSDQTILTNLHAKRNGQDSTLDEIRGIYETLRALPEEAS